MTSSVPSSRWEIVSERMASSVTNGPAQRGLKAVAQRQKSMGCQALGSMIVISPSIIFPVNANLGPKMA